MSNELEIRELTAADARAFRELRLLALRDAPQAFVTGADEFSRRPLESIAHQLRANCVSADALFIGALMDGVLVGMQGLFRQTKAKVQHRADIVAVYVQPAQRGQGIGGAMLDYLLDGAGTMPGLEQIVLGVASTQEAAIRLYRSRGFVQFGVAPR